MSNVLIVATGYDRQSAITKDWAWQLSRQLLNHGVVNILTDGSVLNAAALQDLIGFADYFVFIGHGTATSLVARPDRGYGTFRDLVDNTTATGFFANCVVYAVCCEALQVFGSNCPAGFIGYSGSFPISEQSHMEFCKVVVQSVVSLALGDPQAMVVADTARAWRNLADEYDRGLLRNQRDSAWAKTTAEALANMLGSKP